jgi:hypothetical protein
MSEPAPQPPQVDPLSIMQPGDQAVYMNCYDASCPSQSPGQTHMHLDHVLHQDAPTLPAQ